MWKRKLGCGLKSRHDKNSRADRDGILQSCNNKSADFQFFYEAGSRLETAKRTRNGSRRSDEGTDHHGLRLRGQNARAAQSAEKNARNQSRKISPIWSGRKLVGN